jgi:hypothetical protein
MVLDWNDAICMRAALIVKSCSSCFSTSVSVQGSVSETNCMCPISAYNSTSNIDRRAIALVPGRAQFSTLANRDSRHYAATAQFSSTAGPPGAKGAVTFNRGASQYLDGGSHQFNIATNGGFTAIAVVRFTGTLLNLERIFDFGNGADNDNIMVWRNEETSQLNFGIWNGNSPCMIHVPDVIEQNNWLTIVAIYNSINTSIELRVGQNVNRDQCTSRTDRNVVKTYIGKTFWNNAYISSSIAGLYAVDALLTENEIAAVVSRMNAGEDTLQTCKSCPVNAQSVANTPVCECMPGAYAPDNTTGAVCSKCAPGHFKTLPGLGICSPCPPGTYGGGVTCSLCPAGKFSTAVGSMFESDCKCPSNRYKYSSALERRAIALVPGRAQFSTLANRDSRDYVATAQFNSTAGPAGSKGAVIFDRATSQYLDGGSHTFNITSSGGFTAVAVVKFTGSAVAWERIFEFSNGQNNNNIVCTRSESDIFFGIRNGAQAYCSFRSIPGSLIQDTWLTVVATYNSTNKKLTLQVGNNTLMSKVCTSMTDRTISNTYVGKSVWPIDPYFSGMIAGLYAVDAVLTGDEIATVASRMTAGEDTLQTCRSCPVNAQGRSDDMGCECMPGAYAPDNTTPAVCSKCAPGHFKTLPGLGICSPCPPGTYGGGATCSLCPAGKFNTAVGSAAITSCSSCKKGFYNEIPGATSSESCVLCATGKFHGNLGSGSRDDCKTCNCET